MNSLSDMLALFPVLTGLQLFQIYLLGTICLDVSRYCSAPFFSVLFVMHNTDNHMQSLTIGSIHGWMRMHERKVSARAETDSVRRHVVRTHTPALWTRARVLLKPYHGRAGNLFSWVCTAVASHFGERRGIREAGRKGRLRNSRPSEVEAWPPWPPQRRK